MKSAFLRYFLLSVLFSKFSMHPSHSPVLYAYHQFIRLHMTGKEHNLHPCLFCLIHSLSKLLMCTDIRPHLSHAVHLDHKRQDRMISRFLSPYQLSYMLYEPPSPAINYCVSIHKRQIFRPASFVFTIVTILFTVRDHIGSFGHILRALRSRCILAAEFRYVQFNIYRPVLGFVPG